MLLVATATAGIAAGAASASGPAAPGKELVQLTRDGLGTITVSVQRGENANGAGQLVDVRGHGIPVAATLTLTDLTTSTVLGSETTATGQGNGHPNQPATRCTGVLFQGSASDFFSTDRPPGLSPSDTVQLTIDGLALSPDNNIFLFCRDFVVKSSDGFEPLTPLPVVRLPRKRGGWPRFVAGSVV